MTYVNNSVQNEALAASRDKPYFGFLMEPGMGKSRTLIKECEDLFERGLINRVLILAPKGVIRNWSHKEIPTHLDVKNHKFAYVHVWENYATVAQRKSVDEICSSSSLAILCMNIEALSMSKHGEKIAAKFLSSGRSYLGIDEATTMKNESSSRSEAVHRIQHLCLYRRVLTGTPFASGPDAVYGLIRAVHPFPLNHRSQQSFRSRYALVKRIKVPDTRPFKIAEAKARGDTEKPTRLIDAVDGFLNEPELRDKMSKFCFFAAKKDYLDLPDKVRVTRDVELTVEQARVINDLRENWLHEMGENSFVTIKNALGLRLRILQIYSGHVPDVVDGSIKEIPSRRVTALLEQLEEYGPGSVIWAVFKKSHDDIAKALGERAVFFNGRTSQSDRTRAISMFQDGSVDHFVGSEAGGFGITLTRANSEIYSTQVSSVEMRIQTGDRTHRIGQKNSVVSCDLIVARGLDEKIRNSHLAGVDLSGELMGKQQADDYLFGGR